MKKLLVIMLMLVYGVSATGATVHLHFCCGKLDDVSFSAPDKKACPAKAAFAKKCCENKHVELKVKADQEPAAKWVATQKNVVLSSYTALAQSPVALFLGSGEPVCHGATTRTRYAPPLHSTPRF